MYEQIPIDKINAAFASLSKKLEQINTNNNVE
jgi:hypothetical protein